MVRNYSTCIITYDKPSESNDHATHVLIYEVHVTFMSGSGGVRNHYIKVITVRETFFASWLLRRLLVPM